MTFKTMFAAVAMAFAMAISFAPAGNAAPVTAQPIGVATGSHARLLTVADHHRGRYHGRRHHGRHHGYRGRHHYRGRYYGRHHRHYRHYRRDRTCVRVGILGFCR